MKKQSQLFQFQVGARSWFETMTDGSKIVKNLHFFTKIMSILLVNRISSENFRVYACSI